MERVVGIALGTTFTTAAVCREGAAEAVPLGAHGASIPTVVFLDPDGSVIIGEAAQRRALTNPERVVRDFVRRIGDDTYLQVGGNTTDPETLAAAFVAAVLDRVARQEAERADTVVLACPATWGVQQLGWFVSGLAPQGVAHVEFITEAVAAALYYAGTGAMAPGDAVGIYDLGGTNFDAAVLRLGEDGRISTLGQPIRIERLGGMTFDEAVLSHVVAASPTAAKLVGERATATEPGTLAVAAALRRECADAKEALSVEAEVTVAVMTADGCDQVRMSRAVLEHRIEPAVVRTVQAMSDTVSAAGLIPADLAAVLLVGGSSRIPLVARLLGARFPVRIEVDPNPDAVIARGAAVAAGKGLRTAVEAPREGMAAIRVAPPPVAAHPAPAVEDTEPIADVPAADPAEAADAAGGADVPGPPGFVEVGWPAEDVPASEPAAGFPEVPAEPWVAIPRTPWALSGKEPRHAGRRSAVVAGVLSVLATVGIAGTLALGGSSGDREFRAAIPPGPEPTDGRSPPAPAVPPLMGGIPLAERPAPAGSWHSLLVDTIPATRDGVASDRSPPALAVVRQPAASPTKTPLQGRTGEGGPAPGGPPTSSPPPSSPPPPPSSPPPPPTSPPPTSPPPPTDFPELPEPPASPRFNIPTGSTSPTGTFGAQTSGN